MKLTDPYEHIEDQPLENGTPPFIRVASTVSRSDLYTIRSVCMDSGIIKNTINHLVKHLANFCHANNYSLEDRAKLVDYIQRLLPENVPAGERNLDYVGRRTPDIRPTSPLDPELATASTGKQTSKASVVGKKHKPQSKS